MFSQFRKENLKEINGNSKIQTQNTKQHETQEKMLTQDQLQQKKVLQETTYMHKLPAEIIPFSSQEGRLLFKQALEDGTLECYFPLSEQFLTQMPATCGTTSLVMILNTLKIDPLKQWEGNWRWFNEFNLSGITQHQIDHGINLGDLGHLAKHNRASVLTFYHQNQTNYTPQNSTMKFSCTERCKCSEQMNLVASFETFQLCIEASSRLYGIYLILNFQRKKLNQHGYGHYAPVGGWNKLQNKVLLLDVARFKYPPYWLNIKSLYESFSDIDKSTSMTRGFLLIFKGQNEQDKNFDSTFNKTIQQWYQGKPSYEDPFPIEIIIQFIPYLLLFHDRKAYKNFDKLYHDITEITTFSIKDIRSKVQNQVNLSSLIQDFSYRNQNLYDYFILLFYNYLFIGKFFTSKDLLNQEMEILEQNFRIYKQ